MKTIIAGSRAITDYNLVVSHIESAPFRAQITQLFCGMAAGVDILGYRWAYANRIPIREFRPEWNTYGKMAGIIRNGEMASQADAAIVVWDGASRGTEHLLKYMRGLDPAVHLHLLKVPRTRLDGLLLNVAYPASAQAGQSPQPDGTYLQSAQGAGHQAAPPVAVASSDSPPPTAAH